MPKSWPFERYVDRYDGWFEENAAVYGSELAAVRELLPDTGTGVEIGVGTGRFAAPLDVGYGVEPSEKMALVAAERGIKVVRGQAERLPFCSECFDYALMVTVICFLDDVFRALSEAGRVLKARGALVVGFIDADSPLGREYEKHKATSQFYREARFFRAKVLGNLLEKAGYDDLVFRQTVFGLGDDQVREQPAEDGFGRGAFVVVRGLCR